MAKKKVLFVIVEGPSDKIALSTMFDKIFNKNIVHVEIVFGDITADKNTNMSNIVSKIGNMINNYLNNYHLRKSDILQILHIVDMDGVFVDDAKIIEDLSLEKVLYTTDTISTNNRSNIICRNMQKRAILEKLISTSKIATIKYQVFYMSCNLDHVLYDEINLEEEYKLEFANNFTQKYKCNISEFIEFISNSEVAVVSDYYSSWQYIKIENNSLKRYTNIGICFNDALCN